MATIDDLANLTGYRTVGDWIADHDDNDRRLIETAMMNHQPSQVWPVLSNLVDNPFPFSKSALEGAMRRMKENA